MKIVFILLISIPLILGCTTFDTAYYTDSDSKGYNQKVFGAVCGLCGKEFGFSAKQNHQNTQIQCCYCGHLQNIDQAGERYLSESKNSF